MSVRGDVSFESGVGIYRNPQAGFPFNPQPPQLLLRRTRGEHTNSSDGWVDGVGFRIPHTQNLLGRRPKPRFMEVRSSCRRLYHVSTTEG